MTVAQGPTLSHRSQRATRFPMSVRSQHRMILTLSVHPTRVPDLLTWDSMRLYPPIPANTYHDGFGKFLPRDPRPGGSADHVHRLSMCRTRAS